MVLTPEDVQAKKFTVTRFRPGYDEDEVDAFLDEVEAELRRLLAENDSVRAGAPAPALPAVTLPAEARGEEGQEAALRTLLLAQRTADEAIAQAQHEADAVLRGAQEQAAALETEARQQHASRLAGLQRERQVLEARIEELRNFEREYRTRLRAYLTQQLSELERGDQQPARPGGPPLGPATGGPSPANSAGPGAAAGRRHAAGPPGPGGPPRPPSTEPAGGTSPFAPGPPARPGADMTFETAAPAAAFTPTVEGLDSDADRPPQQADGEVGEHVDELE